MISGLVAERFAGRVLVGSVARFVSEDGARSIVEGVVEEVGLLGGEGVALTYLSAQHGGPIAMGPSSSRQNMVALSGQLPLRIRVDGPAAEAVLRGTATVEAEPQSFLSMAFGRFVTVFLRESGF